MSEPENTPPIQPTIEAEPEMTIADWQRACQQHYEALQRARGVMAAMERWTLELYAVLEWSAGDRRKNAANKVREIVPAELLPESPEKFLAMVEADRAASAPKESAKDAG